MKEKVKLFTTEHSGGRPNLEIDINRFLEEHDIEITRIQACVAGDYGNYVTLFLFYKEKGEEIKSAENIIDELSSLSKFK